MASRSQAAKAARTAAEATTPTTPTQDAKSVLAALVAAAKTREAAEAAEARKAEGAARKAAMPQPRQMTPEEEAVAATRAAEFRAGGGLKAVGRAHQERLSRERREAAEAARREAWLKTPEGRKAQEKWLREMEAQEARQEGAAIRRAQRGAWNTHVQAEALRLRKEDLFETVRAGERAEARLLELGRLPSSLLTQRGEEVRGCLQAKEAATRAEEELAKLGH